MFWTASYSAILSSTFCSTCFSTILPEIIMVKRDQKNIARKKRIPCKESLDIFFILLPFFFLSFSIRIRYGYRRKRGLPFFFGKPLHLVPRLFFKQILFAFRMATYISFFTKHAGLKVIFFIKTLHIVTLSASSHMSSDSV